MLFLIMVLLIAAGLFYYAAANIHHGIVWADRFSGKIDDVHAMREDIRSRVLMALEIRIPVHEAALAQLRHGEGVAARLDARPAREPLG